jgi:AraC-like DNA-binding protein
VGGVPRNPAVPAAAPNPLALRRLADALARHAPRDGKHPLRLDGTYAIRISRVTSRPLFATLRPSLCIVAQGAKVLMLGNEVLHYDAARMLVLGLDVPAAGHVTRASSREPFLGFTLDLDPIRIAELAGRIFPGGPPRPLDPRAVYVGTTDDGLVEAVTRLVDLMGDADDARFLGPVGIDEILVCVLRSGIGPRVAQFAQPDSGIQRIADVVRWMREHFAQPLVVADMAALAHLSASSFHVHFKAVTTMSPLQYQKAVRLQEARRLMLFQQLGAVGAAAEVGYLSPSQFSREYARMFGAPPAMDIARLRASGADH